MHKASNLETVQKPIKTFKAKTQMMESYTMSRKAISLNKRTIIATLSSSSIGTV